MNERFHLSAFVAGTRCFSPLIILSFLGAPAAQAKQCSAERPSASPAHWSYRLIDGRKCWYEGENGLSKSLLQWPADAPASPKNFPLSLSLGQSNQAMRSAPQLQSSTSGASSVSPLKTPAQRVSNEAPIRILTTKPSNSLPLNESEDFEERWRGLEVLEK
jgi:hypothetical protein